jgi:hypothetical protein
MPQGSCYPSPVALMPRDPLLVTMFFTIRGLRAVDCYPGGLVPATSSASATVEAGPGVSAASVGPVSVGPSTTWVCTLCTFVTENGAPNCAICGSAAPAAVAVAGSSGAGAGAGAGAGVVTPATTSISDPWGVRVSVVPSFSTAHLQGLIDKGSAFVEELRGENAAWTLSQDESLTALVNAFADRSDVDPLALLPDKLLPTVEVHTWRGCMREWGHTMESLPFSLCHSRHSACLGP